MSKKTIKDLAQYCAENIFEYEARVQLALGYMERLRCPLQVAAPDLYDEIVNCAYDWAEDNEITIDEWDDDSRVDPEEIIFVQL